APHHLISNLGWALGEPSPENWSVGGEAVPDCLSVACGLHAGADVLVQGAGGALACVGAAGDLRDRADGHALRPVPPATKTHAYSPLLGFSVAFASAVAGWRCGFGLTSSHSPVFSKFFTRSSGTP